MNREPTKRESTATAEQERRIIEALRQGPKTTDELRAIGCYQAPTRIHALRHRHGYQISTHLFNGYAADGYFHARMAKYTLIGEPDAGTPAPSSRKRNGGPHGKPMGRK